MNKDKEFENMSFREISHREVPRSGNVIKSKDVKIDGFAKISIEEDSSDGVKIVLKKDEHDNIKEIKFVCSCGETKSLTLDYAGE